MYKKEQRDYNDDTVKVENVEYILNSANPFNWMKVASYIKKQKPDLVIFQWLHPYFAPCYWWLLSSLRSIKTVGIVHNALPHERFPMDKFLTKVTLNKFDYLISHAQTDADILKGILPKANIKINPHPAYNFFKISDMSKAEAREQLNIGANEKVLLFFGLIREYKGLKHLLKAMPDIIGHYPDVKLIIAGDFKGKKAEYDEWLNAEGVADHLIIRDGHIPIPEVEPYFAASDIVVLPYESATQSGVIQVAYGFGKPVVATRVGGLPDVVDHMQTGYVIEPQSPSEITNALKDFYDNNRAETFASYIADSAYRFSWERMEETIMSFLNEDKPDANV
jgi:glycosyltransferase involved in cell wall biosynthesis